MNKAPRKTWNIQVTEDDIQWAQRNNSSKCVVAKAIARTLPECSYIGVDIQTVRFSLGLWRYEYLTPPSIQDYIVSFDAGDVIKPFKFRLQRPKIRERQVLSDSIEPPKKRDNRRVNRGARRSRAGRAYGRRTLRENQKES
jgi:hypothetical protein